VLSFSAAFARIRTEGFLRVGKSTLRVIFIMTIFFIVIVLTKVEAELSLCPFDCLIGRIIVFCGLNFSGFFCPINLFDVARMRSGRNHFGCFNRRYGHRFFVYDCS